MTIDAVLEHILVPQNILFGIAFGLSLFQFHFKSRRKMLGTKFISDCFYSMYYFSMGAMSGCMGAAIAGTGSGIQAATPDKWMKRTRYFRLVFAVGLASAGIAVSSHTISNILPLLAVIYARFFELSSSPQRVRYGLWLTFPPWIIYNVINGLYLIVAANLIVCASLSWAIWKHHKLKIIPEPV